VISVLIFASSLVGIRAALVDYEPLELAVFRFVIASVTLAVYSLFTGVRLPVRKNIKLILFVGFLFFLNIMAANYGLVTINAGEASFILNLIPLLTAGLAVIFLKEKLSTRFLVGLIVSFFGVSLIALSNSSGPTFNLGIAFLLIAAITFALFQITQKRLLTDHSPAEVTCFAIWGATVLFLPFGCTLPDSIADASIAGTLSAVYLGVLPSSIAYIIWFTALKKIPVSRAAAFFYFSPVFTIIIGYFWLKEIPGLVSVGGGVLIIAGVIIANMEIKNNAG
jgi:drug/metabolite transporter (DMT)-like permease